MAQRVRSALSDPRAPPDLAGLVQSTNGAITAEDFYQSGSMQTTDHCLPDPHRSLTRIQQWLIHIADGSGNFRSAYHERCPQRQSEKRRHHLRNANGGVDFTVDSPTPRAAVRLHSTNGRIRFPILANFTENPIREGKRAEQQKSGFIFLLALTPC